MEVQLPVGSSYEKSLRGLAQPCPQYPSAVIRAGGHDLQDFADVTGLTTGSWALLPLCNPNFNVAWFLRISSFLPLIKIFQKRFLEQYFILCA